MGFFMPKQHFFSKEKEGIIMRKNSMYEGLENTQAPEFIERAYAYIQEVAKEYDKNTREDLIQESMLHIIEHKAH